MVRGWTPGMKPTKNVSTQLQAYLDPTLTDIAGILGPPDILTPQGQLSVEQTFFPFGLK